MKIRHLLLGSVFAVALPATAMAQTAPSGLYLGAQAGMNWLDDASFNVPGLSNTVSFQGDWTGTIEGGYRFENGFRLGAEVGFGSHNVDGITGGPAGRTGGSGDIASLSVMAVAYYDFNPGGKFRPYIGAGVGTLGHDLQSVGPALGINQLFDSSDDKFAYQLSAGVGYAVTDNVELSVGYRYMAADDFQVTSAVRAPFSYDATSHSVLVGVRYVFGKPAAKPTPVAAPAPAPAPVVAAPPPPAPMTRNFMVFFDFDKSTLTPDAQQVLKNVAQAARGGNVTAVKVTGHADRAGSDAYNQKLSMRRAEAVREYLVGLGLSAGQVGIDAKGESEPMVATADGVREPSNRRAVIIFP